MDKEGINYIFTSRLRQALNNSGWSQRRLASRFGVQPNTANAWFTGKNFPGFEIIEQLAELLNVSPQWLFGADEPEPLRDSLLVKAYARLSEIRDLDNLRTALEAIEKIANTDRETHELRQQIKSRSPQ